MIWDIFIMSMGAIARNKVRSLLTSLGIIIGVASVIALIHLGQAASQSVTESISQLGSNLLTVREERSRQGIDGRRLHPDPFYLHDIDVIRSGIPNITIAGVNSAASVLAYGSSVRASPITGITVDYLRVRSWELSAGREFSPEELSGAASVCLLGATIIKEMYVDREPLGTTLRVGRTSCQVVGVLEEKGDSFGSDQDDVVLMPFRAVQRRLTGNDEIAMILISVEDAEQTDRTKKSLQMLLRARRNLGERDEDDFVINDMREIARALEQVTGALTALLGAIAAISLLVGGIGIMNIMLVSVTERTREIGVRLAIGATARDVQLQFLVEASVLSALGGLVGVVIGLSGTVLATRALDLPFVLSPPAIALGFGSSALIGVVFGFVPARKAARLNPIEALRHE